MRKSDWEWFGHAGHLIVGNLCRFHLCTRVGRFLVSTVGDYYPSGSEKRETVGGEKDSYFETYVFVLETPLGICTSTGCGCGMPRPKSWVEIYGIRYRTAGEAKIGHMKTCAKFSRRKMPDG